MYSNFRLKFKRILHIISFLFLLLSIADLHYGKKLKAIHKKSANIALIFDISYSMNTKDCNGKTTSRLEAAKAIACDFVKHSNDDISFCIFVVKGDAMLVMNSTNDKEALLNLIQVLNTNMLSATGTNLEMGVKKALAYDSIVINSILLFTDFVQSAGDLFSTIESASDKNIRTVLLGFGDKNTESSTIAGDGVTIVMTKQEALKAQAIAQKVKPQGFCSYIDANDKNSIQKLKSSLAQKDIIVYENHSKNLTGLFASFSLVCFFLSYILSYEKVLFSLAFLAMFFCACSENTQVRLKLLQSNLQCATYDYQGAIISLYQAQNINVKSTSTIFMQYIDYNIGTIYIKQGEYKSAISMLKKVLFTNDTNLKFSAYYNLGVIAYQEKDIAQASKYFLQALKLKPDSIEAKINLEIALTSAKFTEESSRHTDPSLADIKSESEKDLVNQVLKKMEMDEWQSQMQNKTQSSKDDY